MSRGLRKRRGCWYLVYRVDGRQIEESARTGDEREARSLLARRRREIADGTWAPPGERAASRLTVGRYLEKWIARRRESGVLNVRTEEQHFDDHVTPTIGDIALEDLTRAHVRDLVAGLGRKPSAKTGKPLAARTVLHVYRTLATAVSDAVLDGILAASPCTLRTRKGELPVKRDADPKWRASAVYTREESETLISDERIPLDRRALYGLMLLGGLRAMEASGRRWRDYDGAAEPLGRLTVASQADGAEGERATKTEETREVPVHPTLAALLADWKLRGFPMLFGRRPEPDDPIVPSRDDKRGHAFRSRSAMFDRLLEDRAAVKLRRVPAAQHAMRATFLSLLEVDGANLGIARRATHAAPSDVVGGYVRVQWADVCREVAKLRLELRTGAKVIALPVASNAGLGAGLAGDAAGSPEKNRARGWALLDLNAGPIEERRGKRRRRRNDGPARGPEKTGERNDATHSLGQPSNRDALAARLASLSPEALARVLAALDREEP